MNKELIQDRRKSLTAGGQITIIALLIANPIVGMIYTGFKLSSYNKKGTPQSKETPSDKRKIKEESLIYEEKQEQEEEKERKSTKDTPGEDNYPPLFS